MMYNNLDCEKPSVKSSVKLNDVAIADTIEHAKEELAKMCETVVSSSQNSEEEDSLYDLIFSESFNEPKRSRKRQLETECQMNKRQQVEKCRYWPKCSLGNKCAYFHTDKLCSKFPACKFGNKCAYKHPYCKFGLSCKNSHCVFSHPLAPTKWIKDNENFTWKKREN